MPKGHRSPQKELPMAKAGNTCANKVIAAYNPKDIVNIRDAILIYMDGVGDESPMEKNSKYFV